jgi:hypothetical protein
MNWFWRTRKGLSQFRLAGWRLLRLVAEEICNIPISIVRTLSRLLGLHSTMKFLALKFGIIQNRQSIPLTPAIGHHGRPVGVTKPIIFASACAGKNGQGNWKFSGGIKELNTLVKMLRNKGYEAYMVTYDGTYEPWLIEHQPHISMRQYCSMLKTATDVRCATSLANAKAFIYQCKLIYFWDMDLVMTEHIHFPILASLYNHKKIKNVAGISRTIQAWHMAHFERPCAVVPNLVDDSLWFPVEASRLPMRVGYMNEGIHTQEYLAIIRNLVKSAGLESDFQLIEGFEADVLSGMRSCQVFLSMNIGKDPLWGEGCPRTVLEALSTGCVVVAFDIIGNRETLLDNFNGIIVPRCRPNLMAEALINLFKKKGEIERMRENALSLFRACHTLEARWPAVKEFLEIV